MKSTFLLAALSCGLSWGQAADDCKPNALNIPGAKYPCVYSDNRAMFRIAGPDAQKVTVRIGRGFEMAEGPDGVWSVTTTPLVVGFHYYSVQIDGATVADPSTMTFLGSGWQNSGIEIPEAGDGDNYRAKDVPHGHVGEQWYYSKITGKCSALFRLHAAGLRDQRKGEVSGSVFAARLGRGRNRVVHPGGTWISSWTI